MPLEARTQAREEILRIHTRELPLARDVDVDEFVERTAEWSGADLAALAQEASMLAIREYVEDGLDPPDPEAVAEATVTRDHLGAAFQRVRERSGYRDTVTSLEDMEIQ